MKWAIDKGNSFSAREEAEAWSVDILYLNAHWLISNNLGLIAPTPVLKALEHPVHGLTVLGQALCQTFNLRTEWLLHLVVGMNALWTLTASNRCPPGQ